MAKFNPQYLHTTPPQYRRYQDPNARDAENLTWAAHHCYEANQTDIAETLTEKVCECFRDVKIEETGKKVLGKVTYYSAGIIQLQDNNHTITIPAPKYRAKTESDNKAAITKLKRHIQTMRFDWLEQKQISAAIDGKDPKNIKDLSPIPALTAIQTFVTTVENCDDEAVIQNIHAKMKVILIDCKLLYRNPYRYNYHVLAQTMTRDLSTGRECELHFYGKQAMDELKSALQEHQTVDAIKRTLSKHKTKEITWRTTSDRQRTRITKEIAAELDKAKASGKITITDRDRNLIAREAADIAYTTRELQNAYQALSEVQDEYMKTILEAANVINPDVKFQNDLQHKIATARTKLTCKENQLDGETTAKTLEIVDKVLRAQML